MSRHRLGGWDEMELVSDELIFMQLQRYTSPIVKPWRVLGHLRRNNGWGVVSVRMFDNCYFTEAKARRAFSDVERMLHIKVALYALGIRP